MYSFLRRLSYATTTTTTTFRYTCLRSFSISFREEYDEIGPIQVPSDKLWGGHTQKLLQHFGTGCEHQQMPESIIRSYGIVKKCIAKVNMEYGGLDEARGKAIMQAAEEVIEGKLNDHFPLVVWETFFGTQSFMHTNKVIANRASEILGDKCGDNFVSEKPHLKCHQSTNETLLTVMQIAAAIEMNSRFIPRLKQLHTSFSSKSVEFKDVTKSGIRQITPLGWKPSTLGDEFKCYANEVDNGINQVNFPQMYQLPQGVTHPREHAGINYAKRIDAKFAAAVAEETNLPFVLLSKHVIPYRVPEDDVFWVSSKTVNDVSACLLGIANDMRVLGTGPRCKFEEFIPHKDGWFHIMMPGKVKPTECQALATACSQFMGNHVACFAPGPCDLRSRYEPKLYKRLAAGSFLQSLVLLGDAIASFEKNCISRIQANRRHLVEFYYEDENDKWNIRTAPYRRTYDESKDESLTLPDLDDASDSEFSNEYEEKKMDESLSLQDLDYEMDASDLESSNEYEEKKMVPKCEST